MSAVATRVRELSTSMATPRGQVVTLLMIGVAVVLAFIPAICAYIQTGKWYMNVWMRNYFSPEQAYITAHAVTGMGLLALLFAQIGTGITSQKSPGARWYHRVSGTWIVIPLSVVSLGLAIGAQALEYLNTGSPHVFFNLGVTTIIIGELIIGVYYAKKKAFPEHKDWMLWALIDMASAGGLSRAGMYLMQPAFDCDPFLSDWPLLFATVVATLAAAYCCHACGRLGRKYKANTAMLVLHMLVCCYSLANAIPFSCPSEHDMEPTNITKTIIPPSHDRGDESTALFGSVHGIAAFTLPALGVVTGAGAVAGLCLRNPRDVSRCTVVQKV